MKIKILLSILTVPLFMNLLYAGNPEKRPVELQCYLNSHLNTTSAIVYNEDGYIIKISYYNESKLADYARYTYDIDDRLIHEKTYDPSGILIRKRKYFYDKSGLPVLEKVYSAADLLIEYSVIKFSDSKISKIDCYRSDDILYQTIDFKYTGDRLDSILYYKTGKCIMEAESIYGSNKLLTGQRIRHAGADIKIETKYIYEEGFAAKRSLELIFR